MFSASSRRGDLKKSMTNIVRECRGANVVRNHAMILPGDATPKSDGIFGKDKYFRAAQAWFWILNSFLE
jgi:hypothetical protein